MRGKLCFGISNLLLLTWLSQSVLLFYFTGFSQNEAHSVRIMTGMAHFPFKATRQTFLSVKLN